MKLIENVEKLCNLCGVSGWEDPVREEILAQLKGVCDCQVDALGNVIAFKQGKQAAKSKVLLSAHMDEVGFIVTYIEEGGLLRFSAVGGLDSRVVIGKAVEVGDKRLYGVIGAKPVHLLEGDKERSEPVKLDKLYIDIGAADREEALAHIQPGDRVVFSAPFGKLGENKIYGRALDDRAGCAMLIELLKRQQPYDLWVSFTVQEETGSVGAIAVGNRVQPDVALVVETTTASDIPGVDDAKKVCTQGKGPVLSFMDRGAIYDRELYSLAMEVAEKNSIPCQPKAGVYGANESHTLQSTGLGVRTLAVSLPCRYIHSPVNVLHIEDMEHTVALLEKLAAAAAER